MNRSLTVVAALAASFAASAMAQSTQPPAAPAPASATSSAAPSGARKVAVIAFQQAVASTNEGRQALAQVQQKFAPKSAELKAESDQVDTLKKQLQAAGSTLSPDERATRLRTIDDKEKSLQRQGQDAQSDFQQAMSEAFQGIAQKFYTVLQDYAQSNGYGLVIDESSQQTPVVIWASKSADITAAVVAEYNQKSGVTAPAPAASSTTPHSTTTPRRRTTTTTSH